QPRVDDEGLIEGRIRDLACDGERHLRLDFDIERDPRHRKSLVEFELGEATEGSFGEVTFERPEAAELTADSQLDPRLKVHVGPKRVIEHVPMTHPDDAPIDDFQLA